MRSPIPFDALMAEDAADCFVIAEIGNNHQGNVEICKEMFQVAKQCGAHAVKLQKRNNRAIFTRAMYDSVYESDNAFAETYGAHREFLEFGWDEYQELSAFAEEIGIIFFATALDPKSADFLAELGAPAFKIASADLLNIPLIRHISRFEKPMFVSTGGGSLDDVRRVYETVKPVNPQLCLMQCAAAYPPDFGDLNLRVIETYKREFPDALIGFSSHDNGIATALAAYMLGARVIEKHFTLNRVMKGTDHVFSLQPQGLRNLVRDLRRVQTALGDGIKRPLEVERAPLRKMAKKLVAGRALPAGHILTDEDIAIKSPGDGLPPYHLECLVGSMLKVPLAEDDDLRYEDVLVVAKDWRSSA